MDHKVSLSTFEYCTEKKLSEKKHITTISVHVHSNLNVQPFCAHPTASYSVVQSTSENWTVRFSNGHYSDTICVRFSEGRLSCFGGHFVKTIQKQDKKVWFSNGFVENRTIWQPDKNWIQKPTTVGFSDGDSTSFFQIHLGMHIQT